MGEIIRGNFLNSEAGPAESEEPMPSPENLSADVQKVPKDREPGTKDFETRNINPDNMPDDMEEVDPKVWKRTVKKAGQFLIFIKKFEEKSKGAPEYLLPEISSRQYAMDTILDSTQEDWKANPGLYKAAADKITK